MAPYIYISGEEAPIGQHGETKFVFASGDPVPNRGSGGYVYENGYAWQEATPEAPIRVVEPDGTIKSAYLNDSDLVLTQSEYENSSIWGWRFDFGVGTTGIGDVYLDNARTVFGDDIQLDSFEYGESTLKNYYNYSDDPAYEDPTLELTSSRSSEGSKCIKCNTNRQTPLQLKNDVFPNGASKPSYKTTVRFDFTLPPNPQNGLLQAIVFGEYSDGDVAQLVIESYNPDNSDKYHILQFRKTNPDDRRDATIKSLINISTDSSEQWHTLEFSPARILWTAPVADNAKSEWPSPGNNASSINTTLDAGPPADSEPIRTWSEDATDAVQSNPSVKDGIVYAYQEDSTRGLDILDGSEVWSSSRGVFRPTITNDAIIGNDKINNEVINLSPSDGSLQWSKSFENIAYHALVASNKVFTGEGLTSPIIALNAENGSEAWQSETPKNEFDPAGMSMMAAIGKTIAVPGQESIHGISIDDGSLLWSLDFDYPIPDPIAGGGRIYHNGGDGVNATDPSNGSTIWSKSMQSFEAFGKMAYYNEELYIIGSSSGDENYGWIAKLDATDGTVLWETDEQYELFDGPPRVSAATEMVYCASETGIKAYDISTGDRQWVLTHPDSAQEPTFCLANGALLIDQTPSSGVTSMARFD